VKREVKILTSNRSVPTSTLLPHIVYPNVAEAAAWLTKTFGFSEHYRYGEPGGPVDGAQMRTGNAWIMLQRARPGRSAPGQQGSATQSLTVFVEDVDAHFQRVKSAGARIIEDLQETVYGERQYGVEDLAGHSWLFSRHARDLSPDEWGATVSQPAIMTPQISPMLAVDDGNAAIEFYKRAFDAAVLWHLENDRHVVAGLSVHGAQFFLAQESPPHGTRAPSAVGFTTVRIELFVDDPIAVHKRGLEAGALERSPVLEHNYSMTGLRPIGKMLQGSLVDPFGHMWLIGKILS
jgi:uncharacterized glyoxalase superfamily protein PhnB